MHQLNPSWTNRRQRAPRSCVIVPITRAAWAFAAAALLSGCLTAAQVSDIVEKSNAATVSEMTRRVDEGNAVIVSNMLTEGLPGLSAESRPARDENLAQRLEQSVEQLSEFIARHPDRPKTINPLRVRLAVLLLTAGQRNRARVVFGEVDEQHLTSERDRAIYGARETLNWWYGLTGALNATDGEAAERALGNLAAVADEITNQNGRPPSIRYLFEQMRVRIAIRLSEALRQPDSARARSVLHEAVTRYASQFGSEDQQAIRGLPGTKPDDLLMLRWYAYVPEAFKQAAQSWCEHGGNRNDWPIPAWVGPVLAPACG